MSLSISQMTESTGSYFNRNNLIPVVDVSEPAPSLRNKKIRFSTFTQLFTNNSTVENQSSYNNYFGTGADGDFIATSSLNFEVSDYGDPVVKHFKNFTINNGATVSTSLPSRGLIIYVTGDCTIDGTLTMTAKGTGPGNLIELRNEIDTLKSTLSYYKFGASTYTKNTFQSSSVWNDVSKINIFAEGLAAGAIRWTSGLAAPTLGSTGIAGSAGIYTAGGGGGGSRRAGNPGNYTSGAGGSGSFFCGGGGSGAVHSSVPTTAPNDAFFEIPTIGSGNQGNVAGAGNPLVSTNGNPEFGVGGLLILIVKKNINIGLTGTISSNGSRGGASGNEGAGGSGGGRIVILYGGTLTNNGSITANGGAGGFVSGTGGGAGGAGAITIQQVAT